MQTKLEPESILRFALDEKQAEAEVRRWLAGLTLAPGKLAEAAVMGPCRALFLPFWLFEGEAHADYRGRRGDAAPVSHIPYQTDGQGRRVNARGQLIDYYGRPVDQFGRQLDARGQPVPRPEHGPPVTWTDVAGEVRHFFKHLKVCALSELPSPHAGSLDWGLKGLEPYRPDAAAGAAVEQADVGVREAEVRARNAIENRLRVLAAGKIGGMRQEVTSCHAYPAELTHRLVLLPVWLTSYTYQDRTYPVALSGDTGSVAGDRPYSKAKLALRTMLKAAGYVLVPLLLLLVVGALFIWPARTVSNQESGPSKSEPVRDNREDIRIDDLKLPRRIEPH